MTQTLTAARTPLPQRADAALKTYSTQLTAALALVVCVTGVMMFFHLYKGEVEAMHEWLGLAFVAAVAAHLVRHRQPFGMMIKQRRTQALMLLAALAAAAFLVFTPPKGANPARQLVGVVLRAPLEDVAPLFKLSNEEALARLSGAGVSGASPAQSLETIARNSQQSPMRLLVTLSGQETPR